MAKQPPNLNIPLGPFRLHRIVGYGGMGTVWRGTHHATQTPVAVKVISPERMHLDEAHQAFRDEVRAVAGLRHPNIVTVYDYGRAPEGIDVLSRGHVAVGTSWLAMELATGGNLQERADLSWPDIRAAVLGLLDALAHAHARGVIHRDIKPANVLFGADGSVRLADFGIAQLSGQSLADNNNITGTLAYMAPEQLTGSTRDQGPWTDLYALGCMAWALLTGKRPFGGGVAAAHAHLAMPPPRFRPTMAVPDDLGDWLNALLAKSPNHRTRRAADARTALLSLGPVPGKQAGPTTRVTTFSRSNTTRLLTAFPPVSAPVVTPTLASAPPTMPRSWRTEATPPCHHLIGAGLQLFGLRAIPMVGRESQRDRLWRALRDVSTAREPQLIALRGPAGCGVSRLASWLCERAHEEGAATILRANHSTRPGPTHGLGAMVQRFLRCDGLDRLQTHERIRSMLEAEHPHLEADEAEALTEIIRTATDEDEPTFEPSIRIGNPTERHAAIERLIARQCQRRAVILWLDDAQWGIDALAFARRLLESSIPVLVVLTLRETPLRQQPTASKLVAGLTQHTRGHEVEVPPLASADQTRLIRELLGLDSDLVGRIERRTAGNPLFAVQLIGDWVSRGLLVPGAEGFQLQAGADVALPDSLNQVWVDRIDRLLSNRPASWTRGIELAAALGQDIDVQEWRQVCQAEGFDPPLELVETLLASRLAIAGPQGPRTGWSFVHPMLRESIEHRAKTAGRHRAHHDRCARVLGQIYGTQASQRVGEHLLSADRPDQALQPLLDAIHQLRLAHEFKRGMDLAARLAQISYELGLPTDDPRGQRLLLLTAHLHSMVGEIALAQACLDRVDTATDMDHSYRLRIQGWIYSSRGKTSLAHDAFFEAVQQASSMPNGEKTFGWCLVDLANLHLGLGQLDDADRTLSRAHVQFARIEHFTGLAHVLYLTGRLHWSRRQLDKAGTVFTEVLALYHQSGNRYGQARTENMRGDVARAQGDLTAAEQHYQSSIRWYRATGSWEVFMPQMNLGLVQLAHQDAAAAKRTFVDCLDKLESSDDLVGPLHVALFACAGGLGNWRDWDRHFERAQRSHERSQMIDADTAELARIAGTFAAEQGQISRAKAAFHVSLHHWKTLGIEAEIHRLQSAIATLDSAAEAKRR